MGQRDNAARGQCDIVIGDNVTMCQCDNLAVGQNGYGTMCHPDTTRELPDTTQEQPDTTQELPDTTQEHPGTTQELPDAAR